MQSASRTVTVVSSLLSLSCAAAASGCGAHRVDGRADACRAVLRAQQAAWNRGDVVAFARGYHDSARLVFASAENLAVGYAAMLARYRKRYPDRAAMGHLDFSALSFAPLGADTMSVRGRWRLTRAKPLAGHFLLVMRRVGAGWRVVLDYTTLDHGRDRARERARGRAK